MTILFARRTAKFFTACFWASALAACVLMTAVVWAQSQSVQSGGTRFAIVDMKRVIDGAPQFAAGKQRVIQELGSIEIRLKADEAALLELKRKREQQAASLPKAELESLLRTIEASERALKRGRDDFNQRLTLRTNEVVRDLERKIGEVIADVAKSQGVDAVISDEAAIYGNPKLDITDAVLLKLKSAK
jgi:outer membrane protein